MGWLTFGLLSQLPFPEPVTVPSPVSGLSFFLFAQKELLLSWSTSVSVCRIPGGSAVVFAWL